MKHIVELDYSDLEVRVLAREGQDTVRDMADAMAYSMAMTGRMMGVSPDIQAIPRGPHKPATIKDRLDQLHKRARALSCPHCAAQPGEPCFKPQRKRPIAGMHHLRRVKAEWVIDNERPDE